MPSQEHAPWKDEGLLRQKYIAEGKSPREIADELDCGQTTVLRHLDRFGIEKRQSYDDEPPWKDPRKLNEKYHKECRSTTEIADEWGCSSETIRRWMNNHEIPFEREDNPAKPWTDRETLRHLYVEQGKSTYAVADKLGCSAGTIGHWLDEFGIERRSEGSGISKDAPWKDEETLHQLYVEDRKSSPKIARELGCQGETIRLWLEEFGIPRRRKYPYFGANERGYEKIIHTVDGETTRVPVHRLIAVAERDLDPSDLFNADYHVHHKQNIPWLNTPGNLEVLTKEEHLRLHAQERERREDNKFKPD